MDSHSEVSKFDVVVADFLRRRDAGLATDWRELLAAHPDLEGELSEFFADHEQMHRIYKEEATLVPQSDSASTPTLTQRWDGLAHAPRYFGNYELSRELGRGGMGIVYQAREIKLDRMVALKLMPSADHASLEDVKRFRNEAEAIARLDHPNIIPIYEIGEEQGHPYLAMKYFEIGSLANHMQEFVGKDRSIAVLVSKIARGVQHAHERGVVHRDLKPGNILLAPLDNELLFEPCLADFGLAKRLDLEQSLTQSGAILGTPAYMAPEQAQAKKEVGPAADIYSLGAILYHLLTGQRPFTGHDPVSTLVKVQTEDPLPPRTVRPSIPRDLETICLKCLNKSAANRYPSALEFAQDLDRWLHGDSIHARPESSLRRFWVWTRRRWVAAALVVILPVTIGLALALALKMPNGGLTEPAPTQPGVVDPVAETREKRRVHARNMQDIQDIINNKNHAKAKALLNIKPIENDWEFLHLIMQAFAPESAFGTITTDSTIDDFAMSGDGSHLAALTGNNALVWPNLASHKGDLDRFNVPGARRIAWSDANLLVATDDTVRVVWRPQRAKMPRALKTHLSDIRAFAGGKGIVACADGEGRILVLRVPASVGQTEWKEVARFSRDKALCLAIDQGGQLLAAGAEDGVTVWAMKDAREFASQSELKTVQEVALYLNGLLANCANSRWALCDFHFPNPIVAQSRGRAAINQNGTRVALLGEDGKLRILYPDDEQVILQLPGQLSPNARIRFHAGFLVACEDKRLLYWSGNK